MKSPWLRLTPVNDPETAIDMPTAPVVSLDTLAHQVKRDLLRRADAHRELEAAEIAVRLSRRALQEAVEKLQTSDEFDHHE